MPASIALLTSPCGYAQALIALHAFITLSASRPTHGGLVAQLAVRPPGSSRRFKSPSQPTVITSEAVRLMLSLSGCAVFLHAAQDLLAQVPPRNTKTEFCL